MIIIDIDIIVIIIVIIIIYTYIYGCVWKWGISPNLTFVDWDIDDQQSNFGVLHCIQSISFFNNEEMDAAIQLLIIDGSGNYSLMIHISIS